MIFISQDIMVMVFVTVTDFTKVMVITMATDSMAHMDREITESTILKNDIICKAFYKN